MEWNIDTNKESHNFSNTSFKYLEKIRSNIENQNGIEIELENVFDQIPKDMTDVLQIIFRVQFKAYPFWISDLYDLDDCIHSGNLKYTINYAEFEYYSADDSAYNQIDNITISIIHKNDLRLRFQSYIKLRSFDSIFNFKPSTQNSFWKIDVTDINVPTIEINENINLVNPDNLTLKLLSPMLLKEELLIHMLKGTDIFIDDTESTEENTDTVHESFPRWNTLIKFLKNKNKKDSYYQTQVETLSDTSINKELRLIALDNIIEKFCEPKNRNFNDNAKLLSQKLRANIQRESSDD